MIGASEISESFFRETWMQSAREANFPAEEMTNILNTWVRVMRIGAVMSMPDGMKVRLSQKEVVS